MLNELNKLEKLKDVRLFISGGDVLKNEYIDRLKQDCSVYNTYGPTEATVCAAFYNCADLDAGTTKIPIGKPIENAQIFIVDAESRLAPIGVPGELCIAGLGVASGYLNLPELTAEKFTTEIIAGKTLYRTGDQPDGFPVAILISWAELTIRLVSGDIGSSWERSNQTCVISGGSRKALPLLMNMMTAGSEFLPSIKPIAA